MAVVRQFVIILPICNKSAQYTLFLVINTSVSSARLKLAKNQTKAKQTKAKPHLAAELLLFENYFLSSSTLSSTNNMRYSKKFTKKKHVCLNDFIWLIIMKMRLKMKRRLHRYGPRPRSGPGHKSTKYKMCLSI